MVFFAIEDSLEESGERIFQARALQKGARLGEILEGLFGSRCGAGNIGGVAYTIGFAMGFGSASVHGNMVMVEVKDRKWTSMWATLPIQRMMSP